jgi:hypothetical protein
MNNQVSKPDYYAAACPYITAAAGVSVDSHLATITCMREQIAVQTPSHNPQRYAPTFTVAAQPDEHSPHGRATFPTQMPIAGSSTAHPSVNAELVAAIVAALGAGGVIPATGNNAPPQLGEYFSTTITNATSDLPITVIKELKGGFKNYIPLSLCTHKACSNATRATDLFDTEIGLNEKGEIKLKQKTLTAAKDHYLTTDDFTEIRENFVRGMRRHLVLGDESETNGLKVMRCASMFSDFFSTIAARPDFTIDWPSYRGYVIETYTSWVGRRNDSFGLIFDESIFHQYKMKNLIPSMLEHLKHQTGGLLSIKAGSGQAGGSGFAGHGSFVGGGSFTGGGGYSSVRGRGRGAYNGAQYNSFRGGGHQQGFPSSFRTHQTPSTIRCFLCAGPHSYREHQGAAKRLVLGEHGKWVDKALGNQIVCIAFNISPSGCRRSTCNFSHSCSLCGGLSHGSDKCNA